MKAMPESDAEAPKAREANEGGIPDETTVPHALMDPGRVAHTNSWSEVKDAAQVMAAAQGVSPDQIEAIVQQFAASRAAFKKAGRIETKSRDAQYAALVDLYSAGKEAYSHPESLVAAVLAAKVACNRRTLETGFLLAVKLANSNLDRKSASFLARGLNYAAASHMSPAEFSAALQAHGVKELADREARRQRVRKGLAADKPQEDVIEQFQRERQPAVPIADVTFPEELEEQGGLALLVVSVRDGAVMALDFDNDPKRLLAVLRAAIKRGQISPRQRIKRPVAAE